MAIKFSQFVVRTNSSDLSHIVGYNGVDNIQITPTNFLNSALTGTAGQVLFYDTTGVAGDNDLYWDNTNKRLGIGTTSPQKTLDVANGDIRLDNSKGIMFATLDGNIGRVKIIGDESGDFIQMNVDNSNNHLLRLDTTGVGIGTNSPSEKLEVNGNIKVGDSQQFIAGANNDLRIIHDGADSLINSNGSGDLYIQQFNDDKDIIFKSDDGSGGIAEYFRLDGGVAHCYFSKSVILEDSVELKIGSGNDLNLFHDGTDSFIRNQNTGDLYIQQKADDQDIIFESDNGSGGTATYFFLDGSRADGTYLYTEFPDNSVIGLGNDTDLQIYHSGTNSLIDNFVGDLIIQQKADDKDIIFKSDDGSGGTAEYFRLDGGLASGGELKTLFPDNSRIVFGDGADFNFYHDGTDSRIQNTTGHIRIINFADDSSIVFQCDDGSGGITEYFRVDGANEVVSFTKPPKLFDNVQLSIGNASDLRIYHNSTNSLIDNIVGDISIRQLANDKDIRFRCDDGSGGETEYFRLDGGLEKMVSSKNIMWLDNIKAQFGDSNDLQILHNGTNSFIQNETGQLQIIQNVADEDIVFLADGGSGSAVEYMRLDGSQTSIRMKRQVKWDDNIKATFGDSDDLEIYHDGTNSYIADTSGAGGLRINTNQLRVNSANGNEVMIIANENGEVSLYHNNVKKLDTRTTGIRITGVSEYADNAAAIAGGLTTGDVYRTGDLLKIVH